MTRQAPPVPRRIGIARGLVRLALFRAEGMAGFPDTTQGFLNSFAPMLALALVGTFLLALGGAPGLAMESLGSTVVAMLAQPVVSHLLAVRWEREAAWLRYATAVNWCQWAPMAAIIVLMPLVQIAIGVGVAPEVVAVALVVVAIAYALALSWFIARVGLGISRMRAVALVIIVHLVLAIAVEVPMLFSRA